jgi:hypothetical protein
VSFDPDSGDPDSREIGTRNQYHGPILRLAREVTGCQSVWS